MVLGFWSRVYLSGLRPEAQDVGPVGFGVESLLPLGPYCEAFA